MLRVDKLIHPDLSILVYHMQPLFATSSAIGSTQAHRLLLLCRSRGSGRGATAPAAAAVWTTEASSATSIAGLLLLYMSTAAAAAPS